MRILIVSHGVSDQSLLGGPGRVAGIEAQELARRGHDIRVITSDLIGKGSHAIAPTFERISSPRLSVRHVHHVSARWWPGSLGPTLNPSARPVLARCIAWADVALAQEWQPSLTQIARRLARRANVPFFVQPHGSIRRRGGWKGAFHRVFYLLHPVHSSDQFIASSERERDELRVQLGPRTTIHVVSNPMSLPSLTEASPSVVSRRASWGLPRDARAIVFAHRIVPNKGLDLLIQALAALPKTDHLVVVGPEDHAPGFVERCRELSRLLRLNDRIHFMGPVPIEELDEVLLASDVFVLPARFDIFPMTVLHALACGRPVVMTDACQSANALGGAVQVARPTAHSLAETIASLSPERTAQLKVAGPLLIQSSYSPSTTAAQLEAILSTRLTRN